MFKRLVNELWAETLLLYAGYIVIVMVLSIVLR
jgi:hypothetical protein